jgi:hypothetical protein
VLCCLAHHLPMLVSLIIDFYLPYYYMLTTLILPEIDGLESDSMDVIA